MDSQEVVWVAAVCSVRGRRRRGRKMVEAASTCFGWEVASRVFLNGCDGSDRSSGAWSIPLIDPGGSACIN